jgi:hypothetical protein
MLQEDICSSKGRDKVWRIIVVIMVLLMAGFGALRIRIGCRLRNRLDKLRAQGYPTCEAELDLQYAIPLDAENAADIYLRAFDSYVEANAVEIQGLPRIGIAKLPDRTEAMPISMKLLGETFLAKNGSALTYLHRAAALKHCQYPVKFSQAQQQPIPDFKKVRQASFLLSLEASVHLDNGDPEQAFIGITDQPEHKQKQLCGAIDKANAKRSMFTQSLAPAFARTFELNNRCLAHCRVTCTALALERYYLAQGRLADSVDVLVPEYLPSVPIDPFDGQALRFRRLDRGFVVYSIGEDLSNDEGKEPDQEGGRRNRRRDISFIVKRPR